MPIQALACAVRGPASSWHIHRAIVVQKCKDRPCTNFQHGGVDPQRDVGALRTNFTEVEMIRSSKWRGRVLVACLTLAVVASPVRADEVPLITGEHWTKS